jgi:hypothetical protein
MPKRSKIDLMRQEIAAQIADLERQIDALRGMLALIDRATKTPRSKAKPKGAKAPSGSVTSAE